MNCKNCGSLVTEDDLFCKSCGAPVRKEEQTAPVVPNNEERVEVTSVPPVQASPIQNEAPVSFGEPPASMFTMPEANAPKIEEIPSVSPVTESIPSFEAPIMETKEVEAVPPIMNPMGAPMGSTSEVSRIEPSRPEPTIPPAPSYTAPAGTEPSVNYNTNPYPNEQTTMNQTNSYNNGYMAGANTNSNGNNKKSFIIGAGILVFILVLAIILFAVFKGKSGEGNLFTSSTNKVTFNNYTFDVPTNIEYQIQNNNIYFTDDTDTWGASLEIIAITYKDVVTNKAKLSTLYNQQGYTAVAAKEETLGGISYVTMDVARSGQNAVIGIAKANESSSFGIAVLHKDNTFYHEGLKKVASIVKSAKYEANSTNLDSQTKIDVNLVPSITALQ